MRASFSKKILLGIYFLTSAVQTVLADIADPATLRSTPAGQVIGLVGSAGGYNWLGIPFAKPPLGDLRWRAPRPAQPWSGVLQATTAASPCAQVPMFPPAGFIGSEDCLYLNVWTPPLTAEQIRSGNIHLPVMLWFPGDGNLTGSASDYNGEALAVSQNVIVVTTNYRLGVFGWFRNPALAASAGNTLEDISGNFGTLDLIQALRWTKDNIAAFGGDANNITLFGGSSGGSNVLSLLVAPAARNLMQRAIAQSPTLPTVSIQVAQNYKDDLIAGANTSSGEVLLQLLINDGRAIDRNTAKLYVIAAGPTAIAAYLRSKTFAELQQAYLQLNPAQGGDRPFLELAPQLVRDGVVLPIDGIGAAFRRGGYAHIPIMLGSNRDEYTMLLPLFGLPPFTQLDTIGFKLAVPDKDRFNLASEYLSRLLRADSVDGLANTLFWQQPGKVFAYRLDWDNLKPAPFLDNMQFGATHGLDPAFVFQQLDLGTNFFQLGLIQPGSLPSFFNLSNQMQSYWAQFAATGNPGQGRLANQPRWEAWGNIAMSPPSLRSFLFLDEASGGGVRMSSTVETRAQILRDLEADTRFDGFINRCRFAFDLWSLRSGVRINQAEYSTFLGGICQLIKPMPPANIQGDRDLIFYP